MAWVVLTRRAVARAKIGAPEKTVFSWVREAGMPEFDSRIAAIRAITVVMCGLSPSHTDEQVRDHWKRYSRNVGHHKVARAEVAA